MCAVSTLKIQILFVSAWLSLFETGCPPEPHRYLPTPFRLRELIETVSGILVAR